MFWSSFFSGHLGGGRGSSPLVLWEGFLGGPPICLGFYIGVLFWSRLNLSESKTRNSLSCSLCIYIFCSGLPCLRNHAIKDAGGQEFCRPKDGVQGQMGITAWVGWKGPQRSPSSSSPTMGRDCRLPIKHQIRLPRAPCNLTLNTSRDGGIPSLSGLPVPCHSLWKISPWHLI